MVGIFSSIIEQPASPFALFLYPGPHCNATMLGKMPSCHEVSMLNYEGNGANHLSMQCELHPKGNLDHKSSNGARCAMMVWAHSLELVVGKTFSSQSDS